MLLLLSTDKLQLVTSAAADVDVVASFMDATQANPPVVQGDTSAPQLTTITTAATTDIVAAPTGTDTRNVKTLHIRNTHATVATDVTVLYNRSATVYELFKTNLLPGEQCEYVEGVGFFKIASGFDNFDYVRKAADQTFAATAFADITAMGFAVAAGGIYEFEYEFIWTTATVTVGVGLGVNGPAGPVSIQGTVSIIGGNPATTIGDIASAGFTAYDTGALSTSAAVINTNYVARMAVLLENGSTAGTIFPRWRSETATNTVVKAGSYGTVKRIK